MKKQVVRISIIQSSKILVALYTLLGFLYTLIGIVMLVTGSHNPSLRIIGIIYIFGPLWLGLFGFIFFAIAAAIYNLLASWLGGFEVEVRDIAEPGTL